MRLQFYHMIIAVLIAQLNDVSTGVSSHSEDDWL